VASSSHKLETVTRACGILRLFADDRQTLTLKQVVERTGFERTICFRLLRTLEQEGLLRKADGRTYSSNVRFPAEKRYRIGYASQTHDSFSGAISQGIRWAATEHNIDIIELDNKYSAKTAIRNAEQFIKGGADLVIEFQTYERIAPRLSRMFKEAVIPVIALDIPHPNATFLGVDNHRVGLLAGRALLKAAQRQWAGRCDDVLLLDLVIAGSVPHLRISSAEAVLKKGLLGDYAICHLESRGEFMHSFELTRRHLQRSPRRRTLLTGVNDFAVLGALRAFEEAGWSDSCIAVSVGGCPEARRELRLPSNRLAACVAFFPERYGESLILLALDILNQRSPPSAVYMPIQLITSRSVDDLYPRDIFVDSDQTDFVH
jgi:ribose transport system substrate-binding protein